MGKLHGRPRSYTKTYNCGCGISNERLSCSSFRRLGGERINDIGRVIMEVFVDGFGVVSRQRDGRALEQRLYEIVYG